jgi:hypothetical protein
MLLELLSRSQSPYRGVAELAEENFGKNRVLHFSRGYCVAEWATRQ